MCFKIIIFMFFILIKVFMIFKSSMMIFRIIMKIIKNLCFKTELKSALEKFLTNQKSTKKF